jgi:hypothetical protein
MRALRLHLDTSDYAVMYNAGAGTEAAHIRDDLKDHARQGVIAIGLSYNVVFELLQDPRQFAHAIELGRGSFVERKLDRRLQAVRP